jgi:hypothetical protein
MRLIKRTAGLAAAFMLTAASGTQAQGHSVHVIIKGGPHAGTYDFGGGQCDPLDGEIISMFTPKQAGVAPGPRVPESIEVYTAPAKGKPHGFAVRVDFRAPSGERIVYEIYAIPPELQGPGMNEPLKGRGSVTIEQKPDGTTASFRGQTKDGVGMEGSVTCARNKKPQI